MKPKIGIMQGRLSNQIGESIQYFPELTWKEEFKKVSNTPVSGRECGAGGATRRVG